MIIFLVLSGLCIIFPALMAVWMFFIPRSPEFLVTKGKYEEAKLSLQWFRGGAGADVEKELKEIENNVEDRRRAGAVTVRKLVTQARYVKPLGTVLTLMALQQLSGINYILGYSTLIMEVNRQFMIKTRNTPSSPNFYLFSEVTLSYVCFLISGCC